MIKFEHVTVEVLDGKDKRKILDDISFVLPDNGFVSITGKSGSGKSTILNLISCNIKKTSGIIVNNGINYDDLVEKQEDYVRGSIVSYITQDNNLFNNLTVLENIEIALNLIGKKLKDVEYSKYSTMLGINDLFKEKVSNLSGGERQRVGVLIAIIRDTLVYLCDEPTSALDYDNSVIILKVLKELSKEKLVLVASHDINLINKYEDYNLAISYGKLDNNIEIAYKDEEIRINPNKMINMKRIGSSILYKQKFRQILSIIIIMISMVLTIIGLYNISFNKNEFIYDSYLKSDCNINILSNYEDINQNTLNKYNYLYNGNYTDFYYNIDLLSYHEYFNNSNYGMLFKNANVCNDIPDDEIIITDYLYEELRLTEDYINIRGNKYKVSIKSTNYKWYKSLNDKYKNRYSSFMDLYYKTINVNQNTLNKLFTLYEVLSDNIKFKASKVSNIITPEYTMICGELANSADEVVVDLGVVNIKYGYIENEDIKNVLKEKISINIGGSLKEYTIVGVYTGDGINNSIFFDDLEYDRISNEIVCDINPMINISLQNKSKFKALLRDIDNSELYSIITPYSNDIDFLVDERETMKNISYYLFIAGIILFVVVSIFLNTMKIKSNQRTIGILRGLGCSRRNIANMILIDSSISYFISLLISIISNIIYIHLNNNANKFNTAYQANLLEFSWLVLLLFIIVTVIVELITIFINLRYIKKKDNKNLLQAY
ncbi:MAG: ATP-binding cassette domain-containing protein [Anaeroplasmataceae bacterium]